MGVLIFVLALVIIALVTLLARSHRSVKVRRDMLRDTLKERDRYKTLLSARDGTITRFEHRRAETDTAHHNQVNGLHRLIDDLRDDLGQAKREAARFQRLAEQRSAKRDQYFRDRPSFAELVTLAVVADRALPKGERRWPGIALAEAIEYAGRARRLAAPGWAGGTLDRPSTEHQVRAALDELVAAQ